MLYFGIITSIPRQWKLIVSENNEVVRLTSCQMLSFMNNNCEVTKYFYNKLIKMLIKDKYNTSAIKWQEKLNTIFTEENWYEIYSIPRSITDDTKLINFHFKLVHRIIYTNDRLFKCKIVTSDLCTFCEQEKETIEHLFLLCPYTKLFWNSVSRYIELKTHVVFDLSPTSILLGITNVNDLYTELNFISLTCKYYIYLCRL